MKLPPFRATLRQAQAGFVVVLDDYLVIEAEPVDQALTFLLDHLPPQLHLDIATLATRTEGWIAGLQLAALALQGTISVHGPQDTTIFIKSFTGSHRFVLDYLIKEVLQQQSENDPICVYIMPGRCN